MFHANNYVDTPAETKEKLSLFKTIPISQMDQKYLEVTGQNEDPFVSMLGNAVFYKIPQYAVYQKIAGNFRIKHFMPSDLFYKQAIYGNNDSLYWLIDEKILFQVLAFQDELEKNGFDRDAFVITNGYRHPAYNKQIGGAKQSRHIVGEAVDITAKDVNKDGKINQDDKRIILAAAEIVVGNTGGVGRYPNTLSIHMDTRGYKARWDSF